MQLISKTSHQRLWSLELLPAALRSARLPSCVVSATPAKAWLALSPQGQVGFHFTQIQRNWRTTA